MGETPPATITGNPDPTTGSVLPTGSSVEASDGGRRSRRRAGGSRVEYGRYIRSDRWRFSQARLAELLASGGRCRICDAGAEADALTVHHRNYARLGCEVVDDLTTLCGPCHDGVTDMLRRRSDQSRALPRPIDIHAAVQRVLIDSREVEA